MYAVLVINIEAPLQGAFHYEIPRDLEPILHIGHLVEVEFGRRLAQGVVIAFDAHAPVAEVKPIIALIDETPVVKPWQVALAQWMSEMYLAPLNGCLRLMLPPGLTRWSDVVVDINPHWDGNARLTATQQQLIDLLRDMGELRGRQIRRLMPKTDWKTAVTQLYNRDILRKASVLDPPRVRPKQVRTVALMASAERLREVLPQLGRKSKQADVLLYLAELDDPLPEETAVIQATGAAQKHINALREAELITVSDIEAALSQKSRLISLAIPHADVLRAVMQLRGAESYYHIIEKLRAAMQPVALGDIYAHTGANINHLRKLVKLDLVRFGSEEVWRDPLADRDFTPVQAPELTSDQVRAWGRVKVAMIKAGEADFGDIPPAFLLHGVTGSGKTEIYMRAIDYALAQGQRAIVLVPEIALTPQTVRRFAARFPGRVAVLHSRLTEGERYDTWRRARQGLFDIVVGPRSALFTPLPHLGVIVVDEEHDASYKQTPPVPPPYYHARETAVQLGQILNATVILGSATPDLVTYHKAQSGEYQLIELPKRVMGHRARVESQAERLAVTSVYQRDGCDPEDALTIPLPPIQVVDLRQELRAGNRSIFSRALHKAISETLARGEQAILFLNRRGTSSFVICRDCGYVARCPRCDMPLTYHRPHASLVCHHCGRREAQTSECPACGSNRIRYFGLGTEQVEAQVQQRWPQARITRWDRDTTAGRYAHEQLLASFINQEADILVGTQMIAKGLDLPLVTLVGVISADVSLSLPDYRTGERAYQVLSQVAGRAGRGLLGGRVIMQTYQPEHYAVVAAADHDYAGFYIDEIRFRTQHTLPPFRRMAKLVWVDPINERGQREADRMAKALRLHARDLALAATEILGPVPPFFNRIDGRYRWQIIVRSPNPNRLLVDFPIAAKWIVDIDPVSTL
ncbi:MAG: primosomal protein N' [Chloroflexi bacterium]|nr:MAG: primosomal protein N' [Chloroflexota bacterium]